MHRTRRLAIVLTATMLHALAVAGCGGADEPEAKAAALQPAAASSFQVISPQFLRNQAPSPHPAKAHLYRGRFVAPLELGAASPPGTVSLALIADDPENEAGLWVHWVLYNIPPDVTGLPEGVPTTTTVLPDGTTQGVNDFKRTGYGGPCPPPNWIWKGGGVPQERGKFKLSTPHKYYFRLYALDAQVGLTAGATKDELLEAMDGHILAEAQTVGKYLRPPQEIRGTDISPIPYTATPAPTP